MQAGSEPRRTANSRFGPWGVETSEVTRITDRIGGLKEESKGPNEEIMKSKILVITTTLLMALALMAQTAAQATPAPADKATTCACCNHDKSDAKPGEKMECCGKDGGCCKEGKCDMKAHKDGKMACCSGDKCPMMAQKDGKAGCCGDKCPMMKGGKSTAGLSHGAKDSCCKSAAAVSCCAKGAACCKGGYMPCCSSENKAA